MTRASLLHILDHVSAISDAEVRELEQLATAFPYCQTAHLLLAKAAHDKGSMLAGQRLRRAATYAPDRQLLRQLIEFQAPVTAAPPEADAPAEAAALPPATADAPLLLPATPPTDVVAAPTEAVVVVEPFETLAVVELPEAPTATELPDTAELVATPDAVSEQTVTPAKDATTLEEDTPAAALLLAAVPEPQPGSSATENVPAEAVDSVAATNSPVEAVEVAPETTVPEVAVADSALDGEELLPAAPLVLLPASPTHVASSLGDTSVDYTAYALTAEPIENDTFTAPAPPFYADEEVGYGFDGGSRLGPCLRAHNELTRDLPATNFFPPDALLLAHAADQTPTGAAPSSLAIIERFLQQQPRLRAPAAPPAPDDEQADLSVTSTSVTPALASESLALILVRQGKMTKAIEIYERLMVRQPEKKAYFAAQIDQLKPSE